MTRVMTTMIALLVLAVALTAQPHPVMLLGEGQFSGRLGSWVSGDTIFCVYNTATLASGTGSVIFKASYNGGQTWQNHTVAETVSGVGSPTVSWSPGELIVCYTSGFMRYRARSFDGGQRWQTDNFKPSFESSPYIEKIDGEYHTFSLELPYPQWDQDKYLAEPGSQKLVLPQYQTVSDRDIYGFSRSFVGTEVFHGAVRSNTKIWIRQSGGGENNGWPTFYGPVITAWHICVYPDGGHTFPSEEIFRGGLMEYAPELNIPKPDRGNAVILGPNYYDPNHIVFVKVDGSIYNAWLGTIVSTAAQELGVYNPYPADPLGDPISMNQYVQRDTVWTPLSSGSCANSSIFVHSELWIKGSFATHQVWSSGGDLKIVGDILLQGTPAGVDPSQNPVDSVTLCSENNVEIKYGYQSPIDGLRYHLARDDEHPIFIYANVFAYGSITNPRSGVFTFEYQRPHPSVPDSYFAGQLWDRIDLHRRTYPQTTTAPWPVHIDYPWYNPLWPEAKPYLERGKLQIWGSLMQRCRGQIHAMYYDVDHQGYYWNIEAGYYGGSSSPDLNNHIDPVLGIELGTQNYPGATGIGVGYKKDHGHNPYNTYGTDWQEQGFIGEPLIWELGILRGRLGWDDQMGIIEEPLFRLMQLNRYRSKAYARRGNRYLHAFNERVLYLNGQNPVEIDFPSFEGGDVLGIQWLNDDQALLHRYRYNASTDQRYLEILDLDTQAHHALNIPGGEAPYPQDSPFSDILVSEDGIAFFGRYDHEFGTLRLWTLGQDYQFSRVGEWALAVSETGTPGPGSKLVLQSGTGSMIDALLWWEFPADDIHPSPWGKLYGTRIDAANTASSDPVIPVRVPTMRVWPNPVRNEVHLEIKGLVSETVRADVYNVRGQKVASLSGLDRKDDGSLSSSWDGTDSSAKRLPSGVYLIRVKAGRDVKLVKRVSLY